MSQSSENNVPTDLKFFTETVHKELSKLRKVVGDLMTELDKVKHGTPNAQRPRNRIQEEKVGCCNNGNLEEIQVIKGKNKKAAT